MATRATGWVSGAAGSSRRLLPIAVLASALSCRAPGVVHVPAATASCASTDSAAATSSEIDDDLGTRLRSLEEAESLLLAAKCFSTANISMGDWPSPDVRAFNTILDSPRAAESIERLLASPGPAPRLYGACGLYYVAPDRYLPELERLGALDGDLYFVDGCVIEEMSMSRVAERIRRSNITENLRVVACTGSKPTSSTEHSKAQSEPQDETMQGARKDLRAGETDLVDDNDIRNGPE
jgi:hypothetical protein